MPGLWIPLSARRSGSVPPIPAYNERASYPTYLDEIRNIVQKEPFDTQKADWTALKAAQISYIYVGSRGGL